jgi:hypothetical protein
MAGRYVKAPRMFKPPIGVSIDWAHPLTRGLCFCMPARGPAGAPDDIVGLKTGTVTTPLWVGSPMGPALRLNSANTAISFPSAGMPSTVGSCFAYVVTPVSTGGAYRHLFDAAGIRNFALKSEAETFTMYNDGRVSTFSITYGLGTLHSFGFGWNKTGNIQRCWFDGLEKAGSGNGTWGSTALGATYHVGITYDALYPWHREIILMYMWNRLLDANEFMQLHATPWAIFEARRSYYSVAGGLSIPAVMATYRRRRA